MFANPLGSRQTVYCDKNQEIGFCWPQDLWESLERGPVASRDRRQDGGALVCWPIMVPQPQPVSTGQNEVRLYSFHCVCQSVKM